MTESKISKQALENAVGEREPSLDRLIESVPEIMARAERARAARTDSLVAIIPLAKRAIPRLAAVTGAVVMLAVVLYIYSPAKQTEVAQGTGTLEALMLGQNGREFSTDLILDTIVDPGEER